MGMEDHQHNPDPNENAARIVSDATTTDARTIADIEAAWQEWSKHIQKVDERTLTLLKAAFEAGWELSAGGSPAAQLGRLGGLKGGRARADKLSSTKRKEIAQKAAAKRWGHSSSEGG